VSLAAEFKLCIFLSFGPINARSFGVKNRQKAQKKLVILDQSDFKKGKCHPLPRRKIGDCNLLASERSEAKKVENYIS